MLNKTLTAILILFITTFELFAQTKSFTISWDANSEPDMYNYQIFRSTSPGATNLVGTIQHPTSEFTDNNIEKGVQYFYRVKAVDFSINQSGYSAEVSAAVPLISGMQSQINLAQNATAQLQLDNFVFDPDDADNTIIWTASGNSNIGVNIVNRVATISAPSNWSGQVQITFKAEDASGFSDRFTLTVVVESDAPPLTPPVFSTIPEQQMNEDTQKAVNLADYVTDADNNISKLQFTVQPDNILNLSINNSTLNIRPNSNWNGQRTVNVTVVDADNNSDQISFTVVVNAVNDAPMLSQLPSQVIKQDTAIIINLAPFVTDIDNTVSELSWNFSNDGIVTFNFNDANDALTISSVGSPAGFDNIVVTVTDPSNASAVDTLTVRVTSSKVFPPQIVNLPDVEFDEDNTFQLSLNNFVVDPDDPVENLFWYTGTDANVFVSIDPVTNIATFRAKEDWFGHTSLWFIVKDPAQNMASEQVDIKVKPVNDRPKLRPLPGLNMSNQLSRQLNLVNFSSDIDNDVNTLTWSAGSSQNVDVNITENGIATFSVSDTWLGQEKVEIFVHDVSGLSDTSSVTVYRQNQQQAPQIRGLNTITITEDGQEIINLADHVSDPDNALSDLEIKVSNNKNIDVEINSGTNEMILTPDANWFGLESIYLEVLDPANNVAFDTMSVFVSPVNDEPSLKNIGNITVIENTITTIELSDYIVDADGLEDIIEISLLGGSNSFFGYYIDQVNYQLTFFTPSGFFGRETYLLKIKDSKSLEATAVFTVSVLEKNIKGGVAVNYFGNETNLNVSWNTFKETKDYIEYGTTTKYGFTSEVEDDFEVNHNHILSGLEEHTNYHFRIVSESTDGNMTYSVDSVFTTGSSAGDKINVFPIPYRENKDINGYGISFTNLPAKSKLNVYNLLGEPVFKEDELNTTYRWNVKNNAGKKLSSGLYMYVINDENNKKISSGKVIIVR